MVVVSRSGTRGELDAVDLVWGPDDAVAAWR